MLLVHSHNAGAAARDVREQCFRHFEARADALMSNCKGSAQVVRSPIGDAEEFVGSAPASEKRDCATLMAYYGATGMTTN